MKISFTPPKPEYVQVTAQDLKIGQAVRYSAGNAVIRLSRADYMLVDTNGRDFMMADIHACGHGLGDFMPTGTVISLTL